MDSQRDDGLVDPTRDPRSARIVGSTEHEGDAVGVSHTTTTTTTTREVTGYNTEIGHYRRPLLGVPWIAALLLVPLLLAALGLATKPAAVATPTTSPAATATTTTTTPAAPATSASSTTTPPAPVAGAVLEISQDGKTVTVSGGVPDAATKTAVIDAVKTAYGTGVTVTDQLQVAANAAPVDAATFGTLAGALKGVSGVIFDVQGANVTISGAAADEAAKTAVLDAIKKAYPTATVKSDGLVVGTSGTAPTSCDATAAYVQVVTSETKVQFATGGATLTADSLTALKRIADAVKKCPTVKLLVAGNTDNVGDPAANQKLSESRAATVKAELVKLGVAAANITTVGNGETKPIASNDTAAGRATNRRVDITVQ